MKPRKSDISAGLVVQKCRELPFKAIRQQSVIGLDSLEEEILKNTGCNMVNKRMIINSILDDPKNRDVAFVKLKGTIYIASVDGIVEIAKILMEKK